MSRVLAHFCVGACLTALLLHGWFPAVQYRLTVITLGGFWALFPDIYGVPVDPPAALFWLQNSSLGNLFWFHYTMDRLETGPGSKRVAIVLAFLFVVTVGVTEWHETSS